MGHFHLLNKSISSAAALFLLLKLHKFKFTERLKDILQVAFSDTEMDVAYVKPVKWNRTGIAAASFGVACLSILLCFCELGDNGNA